MLNGGVWDQFPATQNFRRTAIIIQTGHKSNCPFYRILQYIYKDRAVIGYKIPDGELDGMKGLGNKVCPIKFNIKLNVHH